MIIDIEAARALLSAALHRAGYDAGEIQIISDHLIDCELRGLSFGGMPRALSVIERTLSAPIPRRPITVTKESPVSAALDGGDQVGYLVAQRATDIAIGKARQNGIAMVGAHETWYTGMFSYYLEQITAAGLVGMIAGSGGPRVAPYGGTEGRFSTNPIAFGFPTPDHPVIWDIGTSAIMLGEVVLRERLGELLPEGLAFAADGQPTRDPAAALAGAFAVWGGHKGSGLAMVVQMLGMLAGAPAAPEKLRDCGFFLLAIDPALLSSRDDFRTRVAAFADSLRTTRALDPEQPVRVPFERSIQERDARRRRNQIDVADAVHAALVAFAEGQTVVTGSESKAR
jgi:LDH2 family malate/lactate/ureidoglycolate dehydrogenase